MQETYLKGEEKNECWFECFFLPICPVDCLAGLTVETTALPSTTEMTSHSKLLDPPAIGLVFWFTRRGNLGPRSSKPLCKQNHQGMGPCVRLQHDAQWKRPVTDGRRVYDSTYITCPERQIQRDSKKISDWPWASLVAQTVKSLPAVQDTQVWSLGWEDPLENEMATHSSILAWRILRTERSLAGYCPWGRRIRHNWVTSLSTSTSMGWEDGKMRSDCQWAWCFFWGATKTF